MKKKHDVMKILTFQVFKGATSGGRGGGLSCLFFGNRKSYPDSGKKFSF